LDTVFADVVKKVIAHFPFHLKNIYLLSDKGKKAVWLIETDVGEVILKKVPFAKKHIKFMVHAISYLRSNGINTPNVIKTKTGQCYVKLGREYFVVFEALIGKVPKYKNENELKMILKELAAFHKASRGIEFLSGSFPSYLLNETKTACKRRYEKLALWKIERSQLKDKNEVDKLFLKNVDTFLKQGQEALTILNNPYFDEWIEETNLNKTLCHQDFAAGNLLIGTNGTLYVFDMDSLTVDLPIRDIRKILNKVMMENEAWDVTLMMRMMKAYQEVNPLTKEQYQILQGELLFPHLFYGQVSKYYENREEKWTYEEHLSKIKDMIKTELSKESVINDFFSGIDEVIK
jgi:CotS family spore coat protein